MTDSLEEEVEALRERVARLEQHILEKEGAKDPLQSGSAPRSLELKLEDESS